MEENRKETPKPIFPLDDQTNRAWREQALTRVAEMKTLAAWFVHDVEKPKPSMLPGKGKNGPADEAAKQRNHDLDEAIRWHLTEASEAAKGFTKLRNLRNNGAVIERAMSNLDAAEADLLRRAPQQYMRGQMPHLWAHVRQHLPEGDPRRTRMEELEKLARNGDLDEYAKESIIQAVRAASSEGRREFTRVRSFRNLLLLTAVLMTVIAAAVAIWGWMRPEEITLCFFPQGKTVCPTGNHPQGGDLLLVEFVGLVAAAVSGSASLHQATGSHTRLGLSIALAVLKLPTGAVTAFLGLMLMRGGFVPGLSDLDTSPQILAWAILFGAAQQLVTGLIDRQAKDVLNQVAGKA
jgi:hypothetical protein